MRVMVNKSSLRVLVVEDERLLRWSIAETLIAAGHTVVEADTGGAALGQLRDQAPVDVVLLDLRLPDVADLSLLSDIRATAPQLPIVMMTAFGTPDLSNTARHLGACDVLDKPFDLYALEQILEDACEPLTH